MSRAINKQLTSTFTKTADPIFDNGNNITLPKEEINAFNFLSICYLPTCNSMAAYLMGIHLIF
jgi:hypothetical protein